MKKILALILALCLCASINGNVQAVENDDMEVILLDFENEPTIGTNEFNQWDRTSRNFSATKSSTAQKTEKALSAAVIAAAAYGISVKFPGTGAISAVTSAALSSLVADYIDDYYDSMPSIVYGKVVTGRYLSKIRIGVYIYSDAARTKLLYHESYASDSYPI